MKKSVKAALWSIPILVGLYFIYKQFKRPANHKKGESKEVEDPVKVVVPTGGGTTPQTHYPLKMGVNNKTVESLQGILNTLGSNLVADGKFGKLTEAALLKHFGKNSVDSPAEMERLKGKLSKLSQSAANLAWAWRLINYQNSLGSTTLASKNLTVRTPLRIFKITKSVDGFWKTTGDAATMNAGNYNLVDYVLHSGLDNGGMRFQITKGASAGMYQTDENANLPMVLDINQ